MNVIPEKTYQKKRQALIEEFRTKKETEKKKSIPVKYHHKLFSTLGSFYTGLVVSTYHQNLISASAVSDYLGMKLKHLPEIEAKLYGPPLMKYSLDTSTFLNAFIRVYPPDVFPKLWEKINTLIHDGHLKATEMVLEELKRKDDDAYKWGKGKAVAV